MIKNMGMIDRIIRIALAITVGVLILLKILTGVPAIFRDICRGFYSDKFNWNLSFIYSI